MTSGDLQEEVNIELEWMRSVVQEIRLLRSDLKDREPTVREITAAASFLAQLYSGVENILKRISKFHKVDLPSVDSWHIDLFQRFCEPPYPPLPKLFDTDLADELSQFRKFRHVVMHSYGFQIKWSRMREGVSKIDNVFERFQNSVQFYLQSIDIK